MAKRGPRKTTPRSDVVLFEQTVRAVRTAAVQMLLDADDDTKRRALARATGDPDTVERGLKMLHHPEMVAG